MLVINSIAFCAILWHVVGRPELPTQGFQTVRFSSDSDQRGVEKSDIAFQALLRIAVGVDRNENKLDRGLWGLLGEHAFGNT